MKTALGLEQRFTYHAPKQGQPAIYQEIRAKALEFAKLIEERCPFSGELVFAVKKIEEAVMWANASVARHGKGEDE